MSKKYILLFFSLLLLVGAKAQNYGNEWVVPGQAYFKIRTCQTGFYLLTGKELLEAGVPVNSWDISKIQMWHRGKETAIELRLGADNKLDLEDSLIFYGTRNDGFLDSALYVPSSAQPHKYLNLHSDTTAYFLTQGSNLGNRINVSQNPAGSSAIYHWNSESKVYTDYYEGGEFNAESRLSFFNKAEGWTGASIFKNSTDLPVIKLFSIPIENVYSGGSFSNLEIVLTGVNSFRHNIEVILGDPSNPIGTYIVEDFLGFESKTINVPVPSTALIGKTFNFGIKVVGVPNYPDQVSLAAWKLTYPQTISMGTASEKEFSFKVNGQLKQLNIAIDKNSSFYNISDQNFIKQFPVNVNAGGMVQINLDDYATKVYALTPGKFKKPISISSADLDSYHLANPKIGKSDFIIITNPKFINPANDYASYRNSLAGGSNNALVADINKLVDQFSYGEFSPLAIRNFCRYLYEYGSPKYLFIIGKGLDVNYNHYTVGQWYRYNSKAYTKTPNIFAYVENFVPSGGVPTSDIVYVAGLGSNNPIIPAFPVGRLNAKYENEVYAYLNKVKEHESLPDNLIWRKNLLHLSGGNGESQILDLKARMENLAHIAEDTVFKGKVVKHIVKNLDTYVDDRFLETVSKYVNQGLSYVSFFGHDAPATPDIDIGYVSNPIYGYQNKGKYPMLYLNGCNTVNGQVPYSLGENWLQTADKGAIITLGHTDLAYIGFLDIYSQSFYRNSFTYRSNFKEHLSVGDIQKKVIEELYLDQTMYMQSMLQQMFLQGDPSIRIYSPAKTDLSIENILVESFTSAKVTAVSDSFKLAIAINNYGLSINDSFLVQVERKIGEHSFFYNKYFPVLQNSSDTIYFVIENGRENTYGFNQFTVTLDPKNQIDESNKLNNVLNFQYFIPASTVVPLFPKEYSIVNTQTVNFIAQTTDLLIEEKDFYIELDTTARFNSPLKKSAIIHSGSIVRWRGIELLKDLPPTDSTVYYWRVRFNEVDVDSLWGESSFIFIDHSPEGWSQTDYPQLAKDSKNGVFQRDQFNKLEFEKTNANLRIAVAGASYTEGDPFKNPSYYASFSINGEPITYENRGGCGTGLYALAFNKSDLLPYTFKDFSTCKYVFATKLINNFTNISSGPLLNYINRVPQDDYVMFMTAGNANVETWPADFKVKLKTEFGAKLVDSLKAGMGYVLIAKKGSLSVLEERLVNPKELVRISYDLHGQLNTGKISSTIIGPASSWGTVFKKFEKGPGDSYNLMLLGQDLNGKKDTLIAAITQDSVDISFINSTKYPYLQLVATLYDSLNLTPLNLKKWQVIFSGVPEGTLDIAKAGKKQYSNLLKQEGDSLKYTFVFTNISKNNFTESLKVKYTLTNTGTGKVKTDTVILNKLLADSSLMFNYSMSTIGWEGENVFQAFVNPRILAEEYYTNNYIETAISVKGDKINPVLDVTFDGQHIMDGDIVSPNPYIVISLSDENKFLFKNDTLGMDLYLKKPCTGCDFQKINFTSPEIVSWGQVAGKSNSFKIEFNPKNLPDGIYSLRVQGTDAAGNKSGTSNYLINFEVINESSISNFYPYPNPFSSKTHFVFTLTGSTIPDDLRIQIMTITGKVVKVISKAELGPIHIGNNISNYAWDGRDEFGDQLANGVYLYKVFLKGNEDFSHRKTAGDKAFKKDFGKLYLLR